MDASILIFNPPDHAIPDIIEDLADPDLSMKDIAHEQQTTLAALVAWMARPDVRQHIRDFRSSSVDRCKIIADNYLPLIIKTCVRLIHEYNHDESNRLYSPENWNRPEQQRRNREAARKTLYLLLRLHSLQLDEPVVHADPSRKRTRYQPIEAAQDRDRGLESLAIRPQTLPISAVPSPCPPEIAQSPATITGQGDVPATQVTPASTPTSPSLSSDARPSEGGPSAPSDPFTTDDILEDLISTHPDLAQAATAVRAELTAHFKPPKRNARELVNST